jgi:hypothetical protein
MMPRFLVAVLCCVSLLANPVHCQPPEIAPFRVASGTVLEFHLQTRLHPTAGDALGALPKGTVLQVKVLDSLDSGVDRDGAEFHGLLSSARKRKCEACSFFSEVETIRRVFGMNSSLQGSLTTESRTT